MFAGVLLNDKDYKMNKQKSQWLKELKIADDNGVLSKWEMRFMKLAFHISEWSKDPSSKVGAVIAKKKNVISLGYNGPPAGVKDDPNMSREEKYRRTIHAEVNAILTASAKVKNCTIYITHPPCSQCAAKIIQSKIKRVVFCSATDEFMERWRDDYNESLNMFIESNVQYFEVNKSDLIIDNFPKSTYNIDSGLF